MVPDQLEAAACSCGSFVHTWKEEAAREELAPVCQTQVIIIIVVIIIIIVIVIVVIIIMNSRDITARIFVITFCIFDDLIEITEQSVK